MIVQLTGNLINKNANEIVLEVNGIGYLCFISNNTFNQLPNIGESITLHSHFHVTENSQSLFAFYSLEEKDLFKLLISVSGIGPKIGIQLLSSTKSSNFKNMIINDDVKMLSTLPGIGPKTAKRLIIELKEKFIKINSDTIPQDDSFDQYKDAHQALVSLGYQPRLVEKNITKIVSKKSDISTEDLIKQVLQKIR